MGQPQDGKEPPTGTAQNTGKNPQASALSETWSQDAQDELEDFIERQGIYIRQ